MNVRETLSRQSPAVQAAIVGALALAVAISAWASMSSGRPRNAATAFYTADDGQTTFVDDFFKPYPFDHGGKPAVRAYVLQTDKGLRFVGYLERYTDAGLKQLQPLLAQNDRSDQARAAIDQIRQQFAEVKKANDPDAKWASLNSSQAEQVQAPKPPDGSTGNCTLVFP